MGYKCFLLTHRLLFHFVEGSKLFSLMWMHIFTFVIFAFGDNPKKSLPRSVSRSLPPMFSYKNFMVLCLTYKSLIHFELILVHVQPHSWSMPCHSFLNIEFKPRHPTFLPSSPTFICALLFLYFLERVYKKYSLVHIQKGITIIHTFSDSSKPYYFVLPHT